MVTPSLSHLVVPISLVILIGLFMVQRFGTGAVGWLFGPVIWGLVRRDRGARRARGRAASRRAQGAVADLRRAVHDRPRGRRVPDPRSGRAVRDRRRGAVRRPRPLRGRTDPLHLVLDRAAGGAAQLPRPGGAGARPSVEGLQPVLPAGAAQPADPAGDARDAGDDHRLAGGAHRLVLGRQAGDPARLAAAPEDRAHLEHRGPDLRPADQLVSVHRRRRARADLPELEPS